MKAENIKIGGIYRAKPIQLGSLVGGGEAIVKITGIEDESLCPFMASLELVIDKRIMQYLMLGNTNNSIAPNARELSEYSDPVDILKEIL